MWYLNDTLTIIFYTIGYCINFGNTANVCEYRSNTPYRTMLTNNGNS